MNERRQALGRGLGALIPSGSGSTANSGRPVDVFFPDYSNPYANDDETTAEGEQESGAADGSAAAAETAAAGASPAATEAHESRTSQPGTERQETTPVVPSEGARGAGSETVAGDLVDVPGATFAQLPVGSIVPNHVQPRTVFDEDALSELADSIRTIGVLQPIVVRPDGTGDDGTPRYELIMGERRWRASQLAGNDTVPAIIRATDNVDMLRDALLENLHRSQLNALEEAAAYTQLLEDFGCTQEELATRIARSRPQISNTLRLLKLPPLVQRRVAAGVLSAGHARALLGLPDGAAMERLAQRIVAEGLSVRATEEIVALGETGAEPDKRRAAPRAGEHRGALADLSSRLSDRLDTKVKVNLGQRKGSISIEFANVSDLNRILDSLVPDDPGVFRSAGE